MNKKNLLRLAKKLRRLRHEEHYKQDRWLERTRCGTAACIAGHAAMLAGYKLPRGAQAVGADDSKMLEAAYKYLGVHRGTGLFYNDPVVYWPDPYAERWIAGKERRSRIAADLLEALARGEVEEF